MKNYFLLVVSVIAFAFTSCTDREEIDIQYQVNLVIDPSGVINGFNGFIYSDENGNQVLKGLDMYEGSKLGLFSFVYDENGKIVTAKKGSFENYTKKAKFSLNLRENEKYTIVTLSYAVDEYEGEEFSAYAVSNIDYLNKLTLTQLDYSSYYSNWSVLGLDITEITSDKKDVTINLKPATAMVEIGFKGIHAYDNDGVDLLKICFGNNEKANFDNGDLQYSKIGDLSYDNTCSVDVTANLGNNIGEIINLLPTIDMKYWACGYIGETRYFEIPSSNIDIEAGHTYTINTYFASKQIIAEDLTAQKSASAKSAVTQIGNQFNVKVIDLFK